MKNTKIVFGLFLLLILSTGDLLAALAQQKPVGVPLDGGLLTILGDSVAAYYIARTKNKASDQV